jgi:hypothetical protein
MNYLNDLTKLLDKYYQKLPAFPKDIKDFIVSVSPWLALIFGVLAIFAGINAFGALSFLSPFATIAGVRGFEFIAIISTVILLIQGVIELLAFSPLKARNVRGWNLLYYSLVLSVVSSVVTLGVYNILSSIVGALIGYYFLYQIKSYYK